MIKKFISKIFGLFTKEQVREIEETKDIMIAALKEAICAKNQTIKELFDEKSDLLAELELKQDWGVIMALTENKLTFTSPDGSTVYSCNLYDSLQDLDGNGVPLSRPDGSVVYVGYTDDPAHLYKTTIARIAPDGKKYYYITEAAPNINYVPVTIFQPLFGDILIDGDPIQTPERDEPYVVALEEGKKVMVDIGNLKAQDWTPYNPMLVINGEILFDQTSTELIITEGLTIDTHVDFNEDVIMHDTQYIRLYPGPGEDFDITLRVPPYLRNAGISITVEELSQIDASAYNYAAHILLENATGGQQKWMDWTMDVPTYTSPWEVQAPSYIVGLVAGAEYHLRFKAETLNTNTMVLFNLNVYQSLPNNERDVVPNFVDHDYVNIDAFPE